MQESMSPGVPKRGKEAGKQVEAANHMYERDEI